MKDLAKMCEKMQQCQNAMEKCDNEQAIKDLQDLADQLKEMGMDEKALSEFELAEMDLEEIKECMGCCKCKGDKNKMAKKKTPGTDKFEEEGSDGAGDKGGDGQGARRNETVNETSSEDERVRAEQQSKGKMRVTGQGPVQPKPDKDGLGLTTLEMADSLVKAKDQAIEALRQQKVGSAQRDLVTDFYKNLTPESEKKSPPKK